MKKKTLFAFVLALTIFGAVYGFAATLNVGTNQLSAGNATVASCQATGTPTGTYAVAYDSTIRGYKVRRVTVTGLDAACATKTVSVTLTGAAGANLNTITGTVPAGGGILALTPARRSLRLSSRASPSRSTANGRRLRTGGQSCGRGTWRRCPAPQHLFDGGQGLR